MQLLKKHHIDSLLRQSALTKKLKGECKLRRPVNWQNIDFVTLTNKSGKGLFVIDAGGLYAAPFSLGAKLTDVSGRARPIICDICATWRHGSSAARISFTSGKKVTAWLCCADLSCNENARSRTEAVVISRAQIAESITPEARLLRFQENLKRLTRVVPFQEANLTEKTPLQNDQNLLQ